MSDRRERILDAARGVILREGYASASMHAIARAAGLTRPALYAEFGDRDELFEELIDREEVRVLDMAATATMEIRPGTDLLATALDQVDVYLDLVLSAPETWRFALMPADGVPASVHERVDRGRNIIRERAEFVLTALAAMNDREIDAELWSHAAISASETAARLVVADGGSERRTAIGDTLRWLVRRVAAAIGIGGQGSAS
ncbi:helix-turn-helix domain-containing protein [Nocardia sp. NPDC050710]|uniref:TetR/AcrR family transcriptional regulator n=1 Tax=Nocardia sp. NPDC050710 TaxID=3157220 RepID=UPI0033F0A6FF